MIDPELEFSSSGQSGTLSKVDDKRKITVASATTFDSRETKFKPYLFTMLARHA